jgi:uncharacterized protein with GYD domain
LAPIGAQNRLDDIRPYDFVHLYEAPNDEAMAKFVMTLGSSANARVTNFRP